MEAQRPGRHVSIPSVLLAAAAVAGVASLVAWRLRKGCLLFARTGRALRVGDGAPADAERPDDAVEGTVETPRERAAATPLGDIEGIGAGHAEQLEGLGLRTFDDLLTAGATPKGRAELAAALSVSGELLLRWVNQVDLCRVSGVGPEYADLLEAAGVDTVPELAQRRADNLATTMVEVNGQKGLVRRLPSEDQVAGWIESAKALPRIITH